MWLRLRQIAGVAAELKPVEDDLIDILDTCLYSARQKT